jgi:hypothetical protein
MEKATGQGFTRVHAKRMVKLMAMGVAVFVIFLVAIQAALSLAGKPVDSSFYRFYPIMGALGAAFGFERWWGQEQGDYNPFHGR